MKIEIYEKATGKVVDTINTRSFSAFLTYWSMQCNSEEYGWRKARD